MKKNDTVYLEEKVNSLPPRSQSHGSKRKIGKITKKGIEADEKEHSFGVNFQLIFLRLLVLIFLSMIILTVFYPNWLQKL